MAARFYSTLRVRLSRAFGSFRPAVRLFLQMQGIETSRVDTVSYGEERPLSQGNYESAWSENRRAEFRVTAGRAHAVGTTNKK